MAKSDKLYDIPFVGLKSGIHEFNYEVNDSFFDDLEYSLVQNGNLLVNLKLEKKETMLIAHFSVIGTVKVDCDRCSAPLEIASKGGFKIVYKFGLEEEDDEALVVLHPDSYQVNVKDQIYELIITSIPARKIHPSGECDEEMWKLVQKYTVNSEEEDFDDEDFDEDDFDDEDFDDDDESDEEDDSDEIDESPIDNRQ